MGTKSSPNDDEEVLQLSEAIIRRVKMVLQTPLGTTRLENAEIFGKVRKTHLFPISSQSTAVSMTSEGYVAVELRRRCRRLSRHSSKTRRRIDFGLVAFF